jgi:hypothetical protein
MSKLVFEYYVSKFIMGHDNITNIVDSKLMDDVMALEEIMCIEDEEEKTYQVAVETWIRLGKNEIDRITSLFNKWVGIREKSKKTKRGEPLEKKNEANLVLKHVIDTDTPRRKITTPIYMCKFDRSIFDPISMNIHEYNDDMINTYISAFKNDTDNDLYGVVWGNTGGYGNKSVMDNIRFRDILKNTYYENQREFEFALDRAIFIINRILMISGIYKNYPTFNDYNNMVAHIVLRGEEYCLSVIDNPTIATHLIEYEDYYRVYDFLLDIA